MVKEWQKTTYNRSTVLLLWHKFPNEYLWWKSPKAMSGHFLKVSPGQQPEARNISCEQCTFSVRAAPTCKVFFRAMKGVGPRLVLTKTSISVKSCCLCNRTVSFFSQHTASPSLLFRIWTLHDRSHFRQEAGLEALGFPSSLNYPVALCQTPQQKCWLEARLALKLALLLGVA